MFYIVNSNVETNNSSYNNNNNNKLINTMDKYNTSINSKFQSTLNLQPQRKQRKEIVQKQKEEKQQQQQQQRYISTATHVTESNKSCVSSALISTLCWRYCHWIPLFERVFFLFFNIKLKLNVYTLSSILLSLISMVKACNTTTKPLVASPEDNLLVLCLPANDSKSCTEYLNSSKSGLLELSKVLYPALKGFRGSYDYRMIARINPFWLTFEPPSDTLYYVMGTLYMMIFVMGVTGNGLVIYMFARCKALRTASYILVLNLAISDLLIVIESPIAAYNSFMCGPALGDWGCRLYGFIGGFSGTASIGLLTVIALDRCSVVVNPLSPMRLNNKRKYYYFLMLLAWSNALFFSIIPLLEVGLSVYVPEGYLTTCSFDYLDKSMDARVFMFIFFVFAWCMPLFIICFCYFRILRAVFTSKNIQSNRKKHKVEVRLAFIVLLVIGLWFIAWTPYAIVAMSGVFGLERYLTPTRSQIPALFCKTAACLNPFLYTISHKRFRNELQRLFCKRSPDYQYSLTRSSFASRSSKRGRNRVAVCNNSQEYRPREETYRCNLNSKVCIDNLTIGGVVNSTLYGLGRTEAYPSLYCNHQISQKHHRNSSSHFKNHISPVVSSEDAGIYVLDVDDLYLNSLTRSPSTETKF